MKRNKSLKPTDYDIHLKYICSACGNIHWLSWNESKTKNFKIVCDCGEVFKVRRVESFKIEYYKKTKTVNTATTTTTIPTDLLKKSVKTLISYGFTESEASSMVSDSYNKHPVNDLVLLIKQTLEYFGATNVK
jgi:DNA-directed RNA polymerase subunit RPC12/RpoP